MKRFCLFRFETAKEIQKKIGLVLLYLLATIRKHKVRLYQ